MRVVLVAGVFDLIHVAHKRHLEEARGMGDMLIVAVTKDKFVGKGEGRPIVPQAERLEMIKALRCVSQAALYDGGMHALKKVKPDIFCKGDDAHGKLPNDISEFCKAQGIAIAYTHPNPQTTTKLINRIKRAA